MPTVLIDTDIAIDYLRGAPYAKTLLVPLWEGEGVTLTTVDCLVYATAKLKGHWIATRNVRHYPESSVLIKF